MSDIQTQAAYRKTAKGEEEVRMRTHALSARGRSVLIMTGGGMTGAELLRRANALGDGEAIVGALIGEGFIEVTAGDATETQGQAAMEAQAAHPRFEEVHKEAARFASKFLHEILGPAADDMSQRIESCRDAEVLAAQLEACRDVLRRYSGEKKADEFWKGIVERLSSERSST